MMIDFGSVSVYTGCQNGCETFAVPLGSSLSASFAERDFYVLYTGYSPNHPFGDVLLCSVCRKQQGLQAGINYCPCCIERREDD